MTNDNPDKKDIKRAEVDSARRHMAAKTDDEREFYKRKHRAMKSFKQHVKESLHPKVKSALDAAPPELALHSARGVFRRLRGQGIDSGITSSKAPKGSSRAVMFGKEHDIVVDGQPTKTKGVLKMAFNGERTFGGSGTGPHGERLLGQLQNRAEASKPTQKYATLTRKKDGTYKTNPKGVLPPVFSTGKDNKYLHMGHARDVTRDELYDLTGYSGYDFEDAVIRPSNKDLKNKIIRKFHNFHLRTGIQDFHGDNIGMWTHPLTGEEHLVLRDAGFDLDTKMAYRDTSWRGPSRDKRKFDKLTKYKRLAKKKTEGSKQRSSFKQFTKDKKE